MDREAFALRQDKNPDHERTYGNIQPKKSSNAISKQLLIEQRKIGSGHHDCGSIAPGARSMGTDGADAEPVISAAGEAT